MTGGWIWLALPILLCCSFTLTGSEEDAGGSRKPVRYILYDVNPGEGFNLRRDVYMRMAVFVNKLNKDFPSSYWVLVLPPWGHLYHWQSRQLGHQVQIPWSDFFDVESLGKFVPVIEFEEWMEKSGARVGAVYYLQGYAEGWQDGKFEEKFDLRDCIEPSRYEKNEEGLWQGYFFHYQGVTADKFACLSVQGHTSLIKDWVKEQNVESIMLDRAENLLHDWFGDFNYWAARRSMRFAARLVQRANTFREKELGSSDSGDDTSLPQDWRKESPEGGRKARGGSYGCVHLRRGDYARGRGDRVAGVTNAAKQLTDKLAKKGLKTLFVATDANIKEWAELVRGVGEHLVLKRFQPTEAELAEFQDGGVAIIDQIICSHAAYFIGSKDSTFTFRIQEEREIRKFPLEDTFHMLCPDKGECEMGSQWKIEWGTKGQTVEAFSPLSSGKEEL